MPETKSHPSRDLEHLRHPVDRGDPHVTRMEQWALSTIEATEQHKEKSEGSEHSTADLSRFGLRTPMDVIKFLHSPAGKSVVGELEGEWATKAAVQDHQRIEQRDHQLLLHRLRAALFLWYLEDKQANADRVNKIIVEDNQKAIERAKNPTTSEFSAAERQASLQETINNYSAALEIAEAKKKEADKTRLILEDQHTELEFQKTATDTKYSIYEASVDAFELFLASMNFSVTDDINKLIQQPSQKSIIESRIKDLTAEMEEDITAMNAVVEMNDDSTALIHKHNALNLTLANLHDMMLVHIGKKYYAKDDGSVADSFASASFILSVNQVIVKEGDTYYLLTRPDDLHTMNPEERGQAARNYEQSKLEMMTVKKVVHRNRTLETAFQEERLQENETQLRNSRNECSALSAHIDSIKAARSQAKTMLSQVNTTAALTSPIPSPRPSPSDMVTGAAPTARPGKSSTELYKEQMIFLRGVLLRIPQDKREDARAYLLQQRINPAADLSRMARHAAIPQLAMQTLLKNLERFGVDATRPSVTATKNLDEKRRDSMDLTPFSTNPFKIQP